MENWIVISKFIILAYIIGRLVENNPPTRNGLIILFLLIYICLNMAFHLSKQKPAKQIWLGVSAILLSIGSRFLYSPVILLLPLNICELVYLYSNHPWLLITGEFIPIFLVQKKPCWSMALSPLSAASSIF